jgi:aromatic-L-amino-acid/L-tryptophan decarboxylase
LDAESKEFREALERASDWVVGYFDDVRSHPVLAQVEPGSIRRALPASPPERGEPLNALLDDFERLVLPGITHWNHPRFFAYFGISSSAPGILAELLIATLNVNGMLWRTSPAATEVEEVATDWLRQAIGLPVGFSGVINDTASTSTLYALTAAREAVPGLNAREEGVDGRRLRYYTSAEAHSSVEKAGLVLGTGQAGCVRIATDAEFRMLPRALESAIASDRAAGLIPFAVVPTVGTTSTTSIDPVPQIAEIARREGLWLHVDAAYGGAAAVLPSHRQVLAGCEHADSIVVNPHKWLFTPIDCSVLFCRREDVLRQAFSIVPDYLSNPEGDSVRNLMDFGTSLGRRFRGLKLWFVLRAFGLERARAVLAGHLAMAQTLRAWVAADPDYEVLAPVPFSTVVFRHRGGDDANRGIEEAVNSSGAALISHTSVRGAYVLRVAIGNLRTTEADVRAAWDAIRSAAAQLKTVSQTSSSNPTS